MVKRLPGGQPAFGVRRQISLVEKPERKTCAKNRSRTDRKLKPRFASVAARGQNIQKDNEIRMRTSVQCQGKFLHQTDAGAVFASMLSGTFSNERALQFFEKVLVLYPSRGDVEPQHHVAQAVRIFWKLIQWNKRTHVGG